MVFVATNQIVTPNLISNSSPIRIPTPSFHTNRPPSWFTPIKFQLYTRVGSQTAVSTLVPVACDDTLPNQHTELDVTVDDPTLCDKDENNNCSIPSSNAGIVFSEFQGVTCLGIPTPPSSVGSINSSPCADETNLEYPFDGDGHIQTEITFGSNGELPVDSKRQHEENGVEINNHQTKCQKSAAESPDSCILSTPVSIPNHDLISTSRVSHSSSSLMSTPPSVHDQKSTTGVSGSCVQLNPISVVPTCIGMTSSTLSVPSSSVGQSSSSGTEEKNANCWIIKLLQAAPHAVKSKTQAGMSSKTRAISNSKSSRLLKTTGSTNCVRKMAQGPPPLAPIMKRPISSATPATRKDGVINSPQTTVAPSIPICSNSQVLLVVPSFSRFVATSQIVTPDLISNSTPSLIPVRIPTPKFHTNRPTTCFSAISHRFPATPKLNPVISRPHPYRWNYPVTEHLPNISVNDVCKAFGCDDWRVNLELQPGFERSILVGFDYDIHCCRPLESERRFLLCHLLQQPDISLRNDRDLMDGARQSCLPPDTICPPCIISDKGTRFRKP